MQNHTVKLTVPAKYAEDFRAAVAAELQEEAGLVLKARAELLEVQHYGPEKPDDESLRAALKLLSRDVEIARQAGHEGSDDIQIAVADDQGCVAYTLEVMARKIVGPRLVRDGDRPVQP